MALRQRTIHRLTGLFARWGLIEHPYGREYARERYTITGRRVLPSASESEQCTHSRARMGVVVAVLLFASLLATGVLFSV